VPCYQVQPRAQALQDVVDVPGVEPSLVVEWEQSAALGEGMAGQAVSEECALQGIVARMEKAVRVVLRFDLDVAWARRSREAGVPRAIVRPCACAPAWARGAGQADYIYTSCYLFVPPPRASDTLVIRVGGHGCSGRSACAVRLGVVAPRGSITRAG
jgi:hypothetical protein